MLSPEQINHNIDCFKQQAKRFVDFSDNKAIIVNNSDWLSDLNYIDFLREIGINFSVNKMLAAECYKQRLEKGLTFFELNYMIMQSYDFFTLNKKFGCKIERQRIRIRAAVSSASVVTSGCNLRPSCDGPVDLGKVLIKVRPEKVVPRLPLVQLIVLRIISHLKSSPF